MRETSSLAEIQLLAVRDKNRSLMTSSAKKGRVIFCYVRYSKRMNYTNKWWSQLGLQWVLSASKPRATLVFRWRNEWVTTLTRCFNSSMKSSILFLRQLGSTTSTAMALRTTFLLLVAMFAAAYSQEVCFYPVSIHKIWGEIVCHWFHQIVHVSSWIRSGMSDIYPSLK